MVAVTVVLELENIRQTGADRCRTGLATLGEQVRGLAGELATPVQLVVCADSEFVDPADARSLVREALGDTGRLFALEVLSVAGGRYYEQKNAGAARATGDVVLFLDSDVLPQAGWLAAMLDPFADPDVSVVAGHPYVEPVSLYSMAIALSWFFGLPSSSTGTRPTTGFFASTLAFRRSVQERFPFPSMPEVRRGSGPALAALLARRRIAMLYAPAAQVAHPPPQGAKRFVTLALARGRDRAVLQPLPMYPGLQLIAVPHRVAHHLLHDLRRSARRTAAGWREVGLTRRTLPAAYVIAVAAAMLTAAGELATIVDRDYMVRRFHD